VLRAIAEACVPANEIGRARVVELGAGLGALTELLADRAARVVAVERDRDLVPILQTMFRDRPNVEICEGDAQAIDVHALFDPASGAPRVLCGNLPYQITGSLIERAVAARGDVERVVFMVQREVAERLVATPGKKEYGALSVFTQAAFAVKRVLTVAPGAFHPPPDVKSAVVVMTPLAPPRAEETQAFRDVVKAAFGMRRKTLRNAWAALLPSDALIQAAAAARVSLDARGETLSVEDFARAAAALERERAARSGT
jgi:16S rRNA (adenine1518-N6/adenine1519-N6)-dimethyltransferase